MLIFVILTSVFSSLNALIYDTNTGKPATESQLRLYQERNNTMTCTINVEPCDPTEWKRIDGTCNNLKYPSKGGPRTPGTRFLAPDFSVDYEPRKAKSGDDLPLPRYLRTELLQEGKAHDMKITQLVSYYLLFSISDINSLEDSLNYMKNTTSCCKPEGKLNYACAPNKIPVHDPIHRFSGVSCQNLTRPRSFQYLGCLEFGTPFVRIVTSSPVFDLSQIYSYEPGSINSIRSFKNGLLKFDTKTFKDTGKIFPIGDHTEAFNKENCLLNQYPKESLCFIHHSNNILGATLFIVLFYRQHNYIARELSKLNPCWDDDRLFYTARDINIAVHVQIYFYELLPVLYGKRNLIRDGLLSCSGGFREMYNEDVPPQMADEYVYGHRWFHNIQETAMKLYDKDGVYLRTFPMVNCTVRDGFLAVDDNIDKILAGSFRQESAKADFTFDYDMAEKVLGGAQFASDVGMNDLSKGRLFGFPSYVKYREFCSKKSYKRFSDLKDVMCEERIHRISHVYQDVEDIDLMAGLWAEKLVPGGRVPHTLYCLIIEQLKHMIISDRHWYESPNRPHAFTEKQLQAIRKVTIAGVLCINGDSITKIQPRAFNSINKKTNPLLDCSSPNIGKLNLSAWKDPDCEKN